MFAVGGSAAPSTVDPWAAMARRAHEPVDLGHFATLALTGLASLAFLAWANVRVGGDSSDWPPLRACCATAAREDR